MTATMEKRSYNTDDEIAVHLILLINGEVTHLDAGDFFHGYEPVITLPSGEVASMSKSGAEFFGNHESGSSIYTRVGPRYMDEYDFHLNVLYDLSAPGNYSVCFFRPAISTFTDQWKDDLTQFSGVLKSNKLYFSINGN